MSSWHDTNYPCWLTRDQLSQAQALIDLGFHYVGDADNFCTYEYPCGRVGGWQFSTPEGECFLDAICNGALYAWELDLEPNFDDEGFFKARLKEAKTAIRKTLRQQKQQRNTEAIQLSLF